MVGLQWQNDLKRGVLRVAQTYPHYPPMWVSPAPGSTVKEDISARFLQILQVSVKLENNLLHTFSKNY